MGLRRDGTTPRHPLIIVNPGANRGRTSSLAATLRGIAHEIGADAEVVETHSVPAGRKLVQEAARAGRAPIVACGGDGTINVVAGALLDAGAPVPLGVIAAGSGNDYAERTLGLPTDLRAGVEIALFGRPQRLDAARLNGGWMINAFGTGIDANVAWDVRDVVESGRARLSGEMLYTFSALNQILLHYGRLPVLEVTIDGETLPARRWLLAAVMIGPTAGGGYRLSPHADARDGEFDILLARRMPRPKALVALVLARGGHHGRLREVRMLRGRDVRIRSPHRVQAHADGELVNDRSFDLTIVPGALPVMLPPA